MADITTPNMSQDVSLRRNERILWLHSVKKGFWHRHITLQYIVTNFRAVIFDHENSRILNEIYFSVPSLIIVAQNVRRVGSGYSTGQYMFDQNGFGIGNRQTHYSSQSVGSVLFLEQATGHELIIPNIAGPQELVNLAHAIKRGEHEGSLTNRK